MRGEDHKSLQIRSPLDGKIPACAGKTQEPPFDVYQTKNNPRMRGEDTSQLGLAFSGDGTIPACAGKTPVGFQVGTEVRNDPCARREDIGCLASLKQRYQNDPRARGEVTFKTGIY